MYKSSRRKCWATMVLGTRCKTNTWPVVGPTTRVVLFLFFSWVSKFRDWLLAHSWVQNIWATLHCDIYCVAAYTTGVVRFFFWGFKPPKRKTTRVFFSFFRLLFAFLSGLSVRKRVLFCGLFSLVLPATIFQSGTRFLSRSRLPSWTKKNQKQGVSSCPCTAAVFHSERKRAQSIYAFFSLPVGTTAKRYPLGFVGRRKRSSFQRNLLGTLLKTTTLSAF